jgi:hypothetical protein
VSGFAECPVSRSANDARPVRTERRNRGRIEAGALRERSRRRGVIEILRVIEGEDGITFLARGFETGITRRLAYGTLIRECRPVPS